MDQIKRMTHQAWREAQQRYLDRVDVYLKPAAERRARREKEPVMDFLFEYYSHKPARLRQWSPGVGVWLEGADIKDFPKPRGFEALDGGVWLNPKKFKPQHIRGTRWIRDLLHKTQERPPYFGCYGVHEWAMVYKTEDVRHMQLDLRLSPAEIDAYVAGRQVICSHYDAFRFFTPDAQPLNRHQPTIHSLEEFEQPGCLHANMDIYKWSYKRAPWIPSSVIIEALDLAVEARHIDMRASPYDLADKGLVPIRVETPEGRQLYRKEQESLWHKGLPIRAKLIEAYDRVLESISKIAFSEND